MSGRASRSRTPRNRNPSGWRTEGKFAGLAKGMPNVSSTGLKGERSWSRAERSADLGLDDEMLRAKGSSLIASEEPPGLEDRRARLSHLEASSPFFGPARLERDRCAAAAQKTKSHPSGCLER